LPNVGNSRVVITDLSGPVLRTVTLESAWGGVPAGNDFTM